MFIIKKKPFTNLDIFNNSCLVKGRINGSVVVPGDKSISHRALIIGLLSIGITKIKNILDSEDVFHTLKAIEALGAQVSVDNDIVKVLGVGIGNLKSPRKPIYMGNSGTGVRLLIGLVAGSNAIATFYGDNSLSKRPMDRILEPLKKMGASFVYNKHKKLPITVIGARKKSFTMPISYKVPVASAQVKSAILLAALTARGITTVNEPNKSRDNTEVMLKNCGVKIQSNITKLGRNIVKINGVSCLKNFDIDVPGDPSSAVFIAVAVLISKNSKVNIKNVFNNKLRIEVFYILKKMGGNIKFIKKNDTISDIQVESSKLKNINIKPNQVTALIDEFPILAIAAACGNGKMYMKNLGELKHKESDRFMAIKNGLIKCGVEVNGNDEDLEIIGRKKIKGGCIINSNNDHRIAMAFNILNLVTDKPIKILDNKSIITSFPNFFEVFKSLNLKIVINE
ncbi:MAG: 3-phosphoshikimate 1-carboxyvinyltransferase [Rickettsiales bacterium]|nr:3-phosphoshikimate 1-carboxyvinyltransferase [Rickettsiales bacterium]